MSTASTSPTESTDVRIIVTVQLIRTGSVNRTLQLTVVGRPYNIKVFTVAFDSEHGHYVVVTR